MSKFHARIHLNQGDTVEVSFHLSAKIFLMTTEQYRNYLESKRQTVLGGSFRRSPARLIAPKTGEWHVVMDGGELPSSSKQMLKVIPKRK